MRSRQLLSPLLTIKLNLLIVSILVNLCLVSFSNPVFCQANLELEGDYPTLSLRHTASAQYNLKALPSSIVLHQGLEAKLGLFNGFEFTPSVNNQILLGSSSWRWKEIWSNNGLNMTSDRRLKKNISDLQYGLETIKKLRPVSFQWKEEKSQVRIGFIAQEMENVIPEIVTHTIMDEEAIEHAENQGRSGCVQDIYSIDYISLIPVLVRAISELADENEELKNRIRQLEANMPSQRNH